MSALAPHPLPLAMLCVGKRRFVPTKQALVDSLFLAGGTADGIFKVRANGVLFCTPNGEPVAFLVANPAQEQFFVSAFKQADGRTRYSFGLTDAGAQALGVSHLSWAEQGREAGRVWRVVCNSTEA